MAAGRLEGWRILVVGASSGIGRATGLAAAAEGARVAFAARRVERLEEAAKQAGRGAFAIGCDVTDEGSCEAAVAGAVETLGGLDAFVYAPSVSMLKPIAKTTAAEWRATLDLNLIGATSICRAAIAPLELTKGKGIFLSSISIDDRPPRSGVAPYVVSKVALETLVAAWQGEHLDVVFSTIAVGDTKTEFGAKIDLEHAGGIIKDWIGGRYLFGRTMEAESVAEQVVNVLASREAVTHVTIKPRRADGNPFGVGP